MTDGQADVIVVGSGPAGAQAAQRLVDAGLSVWTVDVGESDTAVADAIPAKAFSELRQRDPEQARYFVGDIDEANISAVKAGVQLTPPRAYVTRHVEELTPVRSETFHPMLSLATGGLGAAWGAGAFTFTRAECERAGLAYEQLANGYREVASDIGISGSRTDDIAANVLELDTVQPAQPVDDNARTILAAYERQRSGLNAEGFYLGRPPIAMLSVGMDRNGFPRHANPLFDMDFYSDVPRSVYRPRFTIEALRVRSGYRYRDRLLALRFREREDGVELVCRDLRSSGDVVLFAKRLVLAAGALNSARIVARSMGAYGRRLPLLCNPYRYVPAINGRMLGRAAGDKRHSLVQLVATLSQERDSPDQTFVSFYSYRSLLQYKIVKEMPLPPQLGLLAVRTMLSSLTVLGVHFPDAVSSSKWVSLERGSSAENDVFRAEYASEPGESKRNARSLRRLLGLMFRLRLLPLSVVDPGDGASIHYAGPLSGGPESGDCATLPAGNLRHAGRVYVADSSSWKFLPAKGPTLTIMAHARNVAAAVERSLR